MSSQSKQLNVNWTSSPGETKQDIFLEFSPSPYINQFPKFYKIVSEKKFILNFALFTCKSNEYKIIKNNKWDFYPLK